MKLLLFWFLVTMSSNAENVAATSAASTAAFASAAAPSNDDSASKASEKLPELPASGPSKDIPTIKLGETIKFDEMGPVIINADGTTRQIDNWKELSEREKEVTWRRISERNEERRKALLEQAEQTKNEQDGETE